MHKCPNCGAEFEGNFCTNCRTPAPLLICPGCGRTNASGAYFCKYCGSRLVRDQHVVQQSLRQDVLSFEIDTYHNSAVVTGMLKRVPEVVIPATFQGYAVTKINRGAFSQNTALKTVTFEQGSRCAVIGSGAFSNCYNLKEINLPAGLQLIESMAFEQCRGLEQITLQNGLVTVDSCAFDGCARLREVVLPNSVQKLGNHLFRNCISLRKVVLPEGLFDLPDGAFSECRSLQNLVLSKRLSSIGTYCFKGCYSLESVIFPHTLKTLGNYAFSQCALLKSVYLPKSVSSVGGWTFNECVSLTVLCEESSKPRSWDKNWDSIGRNKKCKVVWGVSLGDPNFTTN